MRKSKAGLLVMVLGFLVAVFYILDAAKPSVALTDGVFYKEKGLVVTYTFRDSVSDQMLMDIRALQCVNDAKLEGNVLTVLRYSIIPKCEAIASINDNILNGMDASMDDLVDIREENLQMVGGVHVTQH